MATVVVMFVVVDGISDEEVETWAELSAKEAISKKIGAVMSYEAAMRARWCVVDING